jgi:hypothetical protein
VAAVLWLLFAFLVWNEVFDHEVIMAGRAYIVAAEHAARGSGDAVLISAWMPAAVTRAARRATAIGGGTAAAGLLALFIAARMSRKTG